MIPVEKKERKENMKKIKKRNQYFLGYLSPAVASMYIKN